MLAKDSGGKSSCPSFKGPPKTREHFIWTSLIWGRELAARHGAGAQHVDAREIEIAMPTSKDDELIAIHEALDTLAVHDARKAELVKLRYFAGLTIEETAEILGISAPTAKRDWTYARAWLFREITANR